MKDMSAWDWASIAFMAAMFSFTLFENVRLTLRAKKWERSVEGRFKEIYGNQDRIAKAVNEDRGDRMLDRAKENGVWQ